MCDTSDNRCIECFCHSILKIYSVNQMEQDVSYLVMVWLSRELYLKLHGYFKLLNCMSEKCLEIFSF